MKKIFLTITTVLFLILIIFIYNFIPKHNIINVNLIEPEKITVNNSSLIFYGSIKANSLYGSYNSYKYKIKGDKLFLSIVANEIGSGYKEPIYFKINDSRIKDINKVYIVSNIKQQGKQNQNPVWERPAIE